MAQGVTTERIRRVLRASFANAPSLDFLEDIFMDVLYEESAVNAKAVKDAKKY